jgi:hypothetical protein
MNYLQRPNPNISTVRNTQKLAALKQNQENQCFTNQINLLKNSKKFKSGLNSRRNHHLNKSVGFSISSRSKNKWHSDYRASHDLRPNDMSTLRSIDAEGSLLTNKFDD